MIAVRYLAIGVLVLQLVRPAMGANELSDAVGKLLAGGANFSPSALSAARAQYAELSALPGFDTRAEYAFALVLIRQRQFDEAGLMLSEMLTRHPKSLPTWRAKIWTDLAARQYDTAFDDIQSAAAQLEKAGQKSGSTSLAKQREELAGLIGQAFGFLTFLSGVDNNSKDKLSPDRVAALREEVLAKLEADREAFLQGEQGLAAKFVATEARQTALQEAKSVGLAQQEHEQKKQQRELDKAEAQKDFEAMRLQADLKTQLQQLEQEAAGVQKNVAKSQFALNETNMALVAQQGQYQKYVDGINQRVQVLAGQQITVNAFDNAQMTQLMGIMQNNILQMQARQMVLGRQLMQWKTRMNALEMRRNQLLGEGAQSSAEFQAQSNELKREGKKIERSSKKIKQTSEARLRHRALAEQKQAFSAHVPFPFDKEKQRVLAWLEK